MGGAYTSKPDAVAAVDVPPDWNPEWPHPGISPPGYEPEYSLVALSSLESVSNGVTVSMQAYVADHDTYETNDIHESVLQTWTASVDGNTVQLRETGGSYADSVSSGYESGSFGGSPFWGAFLDLEFDLFEISEGSTLTVSVSSTVSGSDIADSFEVEVGWTPATVSFTLTQSISWSVTGPALIYNQSVMLPTVYKGAAVDSGIIGESVTRVSAGEPVDTTYYESKYENNVPELVFSRGQATLSEITPGIVKVHWQWNASDAGDGPEANLDVSVDVVIDLEIVIDGETRNYQKSYSAGPVDVDKIRRNFSWFYFNNDTGELTIDYSEDVIYP